MTDDGPSVRDETTEDDILTRPGCVLPAIDTARGTTQLLVPAIDTDLGTTQFLAEAEYEDPHATVLASSNFAVEKTGPPPTEPSDIGKCAGEGMEPW